MYNKIILLTFMINRVTSESIIKSIYVWNICNQHIIVAKRDLIHLADLISTECEAPTSPPSHHGWMKTTKYKYYKILFQIKQAWSQSKKATLNSKIVATICFGKIQHQLFSSLFCKHDCPLMVNNINGKFVTSKRVLKVLGVTFDSKLQWSNQVTSTSNEATKAKTP